MRNKNYSEDLEHLTKNHMIWSQNTEYLEIKQRRKNYPKKMY